MATNMPAQDMTELAKMQITELSPWDVETQKIEGEYDMDYVASLTQSQKFSVYRADPESVNKCLAAIRDITNPSVSEMGDAENSKSRSFVINMIDRAFERLKSGKAEEE